MVDAAAAAVAGEEVAEVLAASAEGIAAAVVPVATGSKLFVNE